MSSTPPEEQPAPEPGAVAAIAEAIARGRALLSRPELPPGLVKMWLGRSRAPIRTIYGSESLAVKAWPPVHDAITKEQAKLLLEERLAKAERLLKGIQDSAVSALQRPAGDRVFIGHGRSAVWRELKDFLQDRLSLPWEEFNRESVSGIATTERLGQMLDVSTFAFLVMTAEDEHADSSRHARANVIHEVGLFQGRLGNRRAIMLVEDGCEQFSNVHGLTHIPFPHGRIDAVFEEIRRVLEREGLAGA